MAKFDYMNFSDGSYDIDFVVHASKYTKLEAIDLCLTENDYKFDENYFVGSLLRKPEVKDVVERTVRWYPSVPEHCGFDNEGGCYTYCNKKERGSFPVWVIKFEDLVI